MPVRSIRNKNDIIGIRTFHSQLFVQSSEQYIKTEKKKKSHLFILYK